MTTQCEMVLKHLKSGKTLTPIDALNEFGCFRLASRVLDLRAMGYDIRARRLTQGEKTFSQYYLVQQ